MSEEKVMSKKLEFYGWPALIEKLDLVITRMFHRCPQEGDAETVLTARYALSMTAPKIMADQYKQVSDTIDMLRSIVISYEQLIEALPPTRRIKVNNHLYIKIDEARRLLRTLDCNRSAWL